MSSGVRAKIGVYPVEILADHDSNTHEVIASEVLSKLSGELDVPICYPFSGMQYKQGYQDGNPYYVEATSTSYTSPLLEDTASSVLIINTGMTYSSNSELGELNDNTLLEVRIDNVVIARLAKGEPILLKDANATINCNNISLRTVKSDGTIDTSLSSLAVEFLATHVSDGIYGLVETILLELGA